MPLPSLPKKLLKLLLLPVLVGLARYRRRHAGRPAPVAPAPVHEVPPPAAPCLADGGPVSGPPPAEASPPPAEWEYVPEGFAVRDPGIQGWDVESILQTQKAKWPRFVELMHGTGPLGVAHEAPVLDDQDFGAHNTLMAYAYVLTLAARHRDTVSVLDWGSGAGHYYHVSRALLPEVSLDYHCKDLPVLCRGGRELLPEATFHDEDGCLRRAYDLVLVSSSLQYSEDWKGTVARLAAAAGSYLYVTRLPVVRKVPSFVVVQRPAPYGYLTEYLGWFVNREEFLGHLAGLGMELRREFLIYERPDVRGAPEQCECRGFLFRPRRGERRDDGGRAVQID